MVSAQEVCDNGIDDDGDGLVDINDEDCFCNQLMEGTVTADFEDNSCCPSGPSGGIFGNGFGCLIDGWISANGGSPDYFDTCDFVGSSMFPAVPLPIPSGQAAIGVSSTSFSQEPAGVCLDEPMVTGESYDLSFYVGFNDLDFLNVVSSLNINIIIYGTPTCSDLPAPGFSCLETLGQWEVLASIPVSGVMDSSWLFVSTTFISNVDASAIAFGTDCTSQTEYHFLDNIILEGLFGVVEAPDEIVITGDCITGVQLEVPLDGGNTYQWYLEGIAIAGATSNIYVVPNASDAGMYQVVTDNGTTCITSLPIDVTIDADVIDLMATVTDVLCLGSENGNIDLVIDSPNMPYDITWSNSEVTEDITSLAVGMYTVTVTDSNGCFAEETYTVDDQPNVNANVSGNCNNGVEVSIGGFDPNDTYQWYYNGTLVSGATTNPYLVPTDAQGEYYVIITNGNTCQSSNPIDVFFDTSVLDIMGVVNNVLCFGEETGSIDIEIINDNAPYQYLWSNSGTGQNLSNIGIGIYTVTVTDSYGCTGSESFNIEQPNDLLASAQVTQPTGSQVSQVTIITDGGVTPYNYAWSNGLDTVSATDLPSGSYSVIVTDVNGCQDIVTFTIEGDFAVTETISPAGCFGECNGSILLEVTGPPINYTVAWSDTQYIGFDLSGLCAGNYPYTVTDEDGTLFQGVAIVSSFDSIAIEAFYIDTLCTSSDSILISTEVTGGTVPYTYQWSTTSTNDTLFDATLGMYSLTVTDANFCSDSIKLEIALIPAPIISSTVILSGCDSGDTGSIDLIVTNAVEPISYLWSNGMMVEDINGLTIGDYNVIITDGNGCQYLDTISIGANTGFVITETITDVNCINDNDGMIALDIQDGMEPYMINWSHGPITSSIDNLEPGEYTVIVSDGSGCSGSYTYTVDLLTSMNVNGDVEDKLCTDQIGGTIELTIDANGNDYSVLWNDGSEDELRENLESGNYDLEVIDEFGCVYNYSYQVNDLAQSIEIESVIVRDTCGTIGVGSIEINPISGALPFAYLWEDNSINASIENLVGGLYQVTIVDNNGCQLIEEFEVISDDGLDVSLIPTMPIYCFGESTGVTTIVAENGVEPYTYWWSTGATTASLEGISSGITYFFNVTDAIGCQHNGSTMFFDLFDSLVLTQYLEAPLCAGDLGTIAIIHEGGAAPYEYLWSTGDITDTIQVINGTYSVTVTDKFGCSASTIVTIDESVDPIVIAEVNSVNPTSDNNNGSIEIAISGGTEPYSILWSNQEIIPIVDELSDGEYWVTVTDNNGCSDSLSFTLEINDSLAVFYTISNNDCFGDCLGSIVANVSGGLEPYTFLWSDGSDIDSITGLCNGEYQLEISDANGNTIQSEMIPISSPDDIIVDGIIYNISCLNAQDGSITLEVLGGTSPFEYSWDNSAQGDSISELNSGSYEVVAMDNNGCIESASFTIDDVPIISVQSALQPIDCDDNYTIGILGDNPYDYPYLLNDELISLDANNQITGLLPGDYSLSYIINENCEVAISDFVLEPIEDYELSVSVEEVEFELGDEVIITMAIFSDMELSDYTVDWNTSYTYDCGSFTSIGVCNTIVLVAEYEEDIVVTFIDQYGCETEYVIRLRMKNIIPEVVISEVFIPNIISPNGDGNNDNFLITSNDDQAILQSMNVFDRWGNLLFSQQEVLLNQAQSWDGNYNGSEINPGVYIYLLEVIIDGQLERRFGDLTIVR